MAQADALVRTKRVRLKWRPPGQRTVSTNFENDCLEFRRGQSAHAVWNCCRGRCGLIFSATHSRWVRTYTLPPKKGPFQGPMISGGEGGIDSAHPCASPLRGRFAVQIGCPADLSNPVGSNLHPSTKKKGPFQGPMIFGGEGGIDAAHPCASPLRGRFAVQIGCPADLSNPVGSNLHPPPKKKGPVRAR